MDKIEILEKFNDVLKTQNVMSVNSDANDLMRSFYEIFNAERREREEKQLQQTEEIVIAPEEQKLNDEILNCIQQFKDKRAEARKQREEQEKTNLNLKKKILEDLRNLIQNEENIGKAFNTIKNIRDRWKEIGNVSPEEFEAVQSEYSRLNEEFNYNINIYKELKENDLKKNYSLKNQIVFELKKLTDVTSIKKLEAQLRELQGQWDDIGPTYEDKWEKLKEEFWGIVRELQDKIRAHYDSQKDARQQNLELKRNLIEEAKTATEEPCETHKDWQVKTKVVLEIQERWKKIGYAPKEFNDVVWKEFRAICDDFFKKKSAFYGVKNSEFDKNVEQKKELLAKLESLLTPENWKSATDEVIRLQKQWQKIGHAGKFSEQKLWKKFRGTCDKFFEEKDKFFKGLNEKGEENLRLKEAAIEKINNYKVAEDRKTAFEDLKNLTQEFNALGGVPNKHRDRITKGFKDALDKHYNELKVNKEEKEKMIFQTRIEGFLNSDNSEELLERERNNIRQQISRLKGDLNKYENNLGFFAQSKGAEKLLQGVNENIKRGKEEIENLKLRLKFIREYQVG